MLVEDYEACRPLWQAAEMHHEHDFRERLVQLLRQNPTVCLVAESSGEICGCILASYNGFSGYMFRLVVSPTNRAQNIGKMLSQECEKKLKILGAAKVILACEPEVESFYSKLGYTKTTARFMMKALA